MFVGTFQLRAAYVDGAKAAMNGDSIQANPYSADARDEWHRGYRTVIEGRAIESTAMATQGGARLSPRKCSF
jgi:hypothetical protein